MGKVYTDILKRAFLITKDNKFLWFFGIFAALIMNGGVYDLVIKKFSFLATGKIPFIGHSIWIDNLLTVLSFDSLKFLFVNSPAAAVILLIVVAALILAFIGVLWLVVMSQITLIKSIFEIDKTKPTRASKKGIVDFKKIKQYFIPVLGINVLAKLLILLFLLIVAAFLVATFSTLTSLNITLYIVSFIVFVVLSLIISFVAIYSICYVVLKKKVFWESIKNALSLFHRNWMISMEMAFILFIITFLAGLVYLALLFLVLAPLVLIMILSFSMAAAVIFNLFLALSVLVIVVSMVLFGAWLTTFQISSWVLLFDRIATTKAKSKLERIVEGMVVNAQKKKARKTRKKKLYQARKKAASKRKTTRKK